MEFPDGFYTFVPPRALVDFVSSEEKTVCNVGQMSTA